ncbi:MAG: hypothetical protein ACPLXP_00935 [Microgenomates group bacterium]
MKKNLAIALIVLVCLLVGGILAAIVLKGQKSSSSTKLTPTPAQITQELSSEELPVVRLIPRADKRELTLEIKNIKNANSIEYELTYLSKGLSRGVVGTIKLNGETSITRKILLGTCSRNVCKYDEGVTDGKLTLRLRGPEGVIKAIADFDLNSKNYQLQLKGWLTK